MPLKLKILENCRDCGETTATVDGEYVWVSRSKCTCPKAPGPQTPPRKHALSKVIFIAAGEECEGCGGIGTVRVENSYNVCADCNGVGRRKKDGNPLQERPA